MDFLFLPSYSNFFQLLGNSKVPGENGIWLQLEKLDPEGDNNLNRFTLLSYDLKNTFEKLTSKNPPAYTVENENSIYKIGGRIKSFIHPFSTSRFEIRAGETRHSYVQNVKKLLDHIQRGDVYEINYCINFSADNVEINPIGVFEKLSAISEAPFSFLAGINGVYILCASPERFLKKTGDRLISQPIKGTRKRGASSEEDELLKEGLKTDPKERAENIMIVDLVRNDLSRIARPGSVKVEELCEVYTFKQVHQMISTIGCLTSEEDLSNILRATFPMGSMTGAPKVRAMQLIDEYENFRRAYYSGSAGIITSNGDFDLNVIIRSIIYDSRKKIVSFSVGSAITNASDPESEYYECLVKAKALFSALGCSDQWEKLFTE